MPGVGQDQRAASKFLVFEQFQKLNTQSVRQALKEAELAWLENLQPIAPNNLLAVPGPAKTALTTLAETATVMFYANLNGVDYLIVFSTAGAGFAVNIATGAINQFAPDGTFSNNPDVTTWQASRILIADSKAGYSTFDGTLYVNTGNVSPNIVVTNGGSGYSPTSPPSVTITGGSGTGATAHAVVGTGGAVIQVVLDNPGHGYLPGDVLTVTFGTSPGSGAAAHAVMTGASIIAVNYAYSIGSVNAGTYNVTASGGGGSGFRGTLVISSPTGPVSITIVSPGSGYTSVPTLAISGTPGNIILTAVLGKQSVASLVLDAGGTGYTAPPAVTITPTDGVGSGASGVTTLSGTAVNTIGLTPSPVDSLFIANVGNYSNAPGTYALTFAGGGGSLAAGTCTIGSIVVAGGTVNGILSVNITNNGSGYTSAPTVTVTGGTGTLGTIIAHITSQGLGYDATPTVFIGAGTAAAATAHVWPFTVSSIPAYAYTTVAVFQGRVWLGGGPLLTWTGTGASLGNVAYDDFLAADASASLIISDADLIHAITALRAANNYLYIMGDQSVKQIGNISLNNAGNVTLFQILTLSSDQGTIFKRSCGSFNRVFFFANSNGIYAVFGSSVQKISDDLDGIYRLLDFAVQGPQAALADVNNIHNISWLVRYIDPLSSERSLLLIFNGKQWWFANMGSGLLTTAASASLSTGKTTLWGSSGSDITALFSDATVAVPFKWQSALSHHGNAVQRKKVIRAGFAVTMGATGQVTMSVDSDEGSNSYIETVQKGFRALSYQTDINSKSIDGAGRYLGMTITGTLANFVGSGMTCEYQDTNLGNRSTP